MRPAPPRGAVSLQPALSCADCQELNGAAPFWFGPSPSEWPTCAVSSAEEEVQSRQVLPAISRPLASEPVRMSCSLGVGEPCHWPLILLPLSSRNRSASPVSACRASISAATSTPCALYQGPLPMRSRACTGPASALR